MNKKLFCELGLHEWEEEVKVIPRPPTLEVITTRTCKTCGAKHQMQEQADPQHDKRIKELAKRAGYRPREWQELVLLDEWGDRVQGWPVKDVDLVLDVLNSGGVVLNDAARTV